MRGNTTLTFTDGAALPRDLDGVEAALPAGRGHTVRVPVDALAERAVILTPAVSVGLDLPVGIAASRVIDWVKRVWNESNCKRTCVLINVLIFWFCSSWQNGFGSVCRTNISKWPTGMTHGSTATLLHCEQRWGLWHICCCTSSHFWRFTTFLNRVSFRFHFSWRFCPLKATSPAYLLAIKLRSGYLNNRILGSILCVRFLFQFHASLYMLTHCLK